MVDQEGGKIQKLKVISNKINLGAKFKHPKMLTIFKTNCIT